MDSKEIQIDLLQFQKELNLKKEEGKIFIFDPIRNKYLVQTPEEMVRQLVILYFEKILEWPRNLIAVEKLLVVNERRKRFDILLFKPDGKPIILIECKSPKVPISQSTFEQASSYNIALKLPYLMVTNGIKNYCCEVNLEEENFEFLNRIPNYRELTDQFQTRKNKT